MKIDYTVKDLEDFTEHIVELFGEKQIRSPVHLDSQNEEQLIYVFENIVDEEDWVMGSWRQQLKSLLKGVPREELVAAIKNGKSISLCFSKFRIISSAIVAGILPVAVGTAMGIKRQGGENKVVCFLGDMTSETGIAHECIKYSENHDLPVVWVVENNGKSVCTNTLETWNCNKLTYEPENYQGGVVRVSEKVWYYKYNSKYPHAGGLARVQF